MQSRGWQAMGLMTTSGLPSHQLLQGVLDDILFVGNEPINSPPPAPQPAERSRALPAHSRSCPKEWFWTCSPDLDLTASAKNCRMAGPLASAYVPAVARSLTVTTPNTAGSPSVSSEPPLSAAAGGGPIPAHRTARGTRDTRLPELRGVAGRLHPPQPQASAPENKTTSSKALIYSALSSCSLSDSLTWSLFMALLTHRLVLLCVDADDLREREREREVLYLSSHTRCFRCCQDTPWQIPKDETVCINTKKDKPMSQ